MTERTRSSRTSRDQMTHDATDGLELEDAYVLDDDSGPLPNIPARSGYAQYWARAAIGPHADARNLMRMQRRGWRPRSVESVPKGYQDLKLEGTSLGTVISTHDLILMERPLEIQNKVLANKQQRTRDMERAVKRNIFRDHQELGGSDTGFTAPVNEDRARVERGQPLVLGDD